jgi:hypothetical protein
MAETRRVYGYESSSNHSNTTAISKRGGYGSGSKKVNDLKPPPKTAGAGSSTSKSNSN